jgi:3-isopropylmalate/(R)-2-methylmalate dehydratase small subunit
MTMQAFTTLTSIPAPLNMINIDTDMIIPKQFLRTIKRTGLKAGLFYDMRFDASGQKIDGFILDQAPYTSSQILITGENFGCGSSREHAPWALLDFGIRAIIAPSYSDIFYNNCSKNGIVAISLPKDQVQDLMNLALNKKEITIDLDQQTIATPEKIYNFDIDSYRKNCLLHGLDDIGLTLQNEKEIERYENNHRTTKPWLWSNAS